MAAATNPRSDWTREEIAALFDLPFTELVFRAAEVHRANHPANQVQLSTLLSIKEVQQSKDRGPRQQAPGAGAKVLNYLAWRFSGVLASALLADHPRQGDDLALALDRRGAAHDAQHAGRLHQLLQFDGRATIEAPAPESDRALQCERGAQVAQLRQMAMAWRISFEDAAARIVASRDGTPKGQEGTLDG